MPSSSLMQALMQAMNPGTPGDEAMYEQNRQRSKMNGPSSASPGFAGMHEGTMPQPPVQFPVNQMTGEERYGTDLLGSENALPSAEPGFAGMHEGMQGPSQSLIQALMKAFTGGR